MFADKFGLARVSPFPTEYYWCLTGIPMTAGTIASISRCGTIYQEQKWTMVSKGEYDKHGNEIQYIVMEKSVPTPQNNLPDDDAFDHPNDDA